MKTVGVVLSGCGVYDGTEIHEAVITLLALDRAGARAVCMAPDVDQTHVIDHRTGQEMPGARNVLVEAARICRGDIRDIRDVKSAELDALIFPGGFGAAKNLSSFAFQGADCTVHGEVTRLTRDIHQAGKPIGTMCIAPAVVARIFGGEIRLDLTVGSDADEAAVAIGRMGGHHVDTPVTDIVVDAANKVVSTPAYMCARSISEAATGIEKLVGRVLEMT
ncbi:MAG: isoprenoid biosynthesis glyoxalase ElbB [Nitrospirota bacterium]|nr:isoprenoid biosynthesis glyoxalase ElbB [Nitrospirota bacterium]